FFNVIFEGNKITDEDSNFELEVPHGCVKVLNDKGYQGKKLIFGIRPEDLHTENSFLDTFPNAVVSAKVVVSELLGAESQLYSKIGSTEVVAKVDGRDIKETGSELK